MIPFHITVLHSSYTHHSGEIHSDEEEMEEGGGKGEGEEEGELVAVKYVNMYMYYVCHLISVISGSSHLIMYPTLMVVVACASQWGPLLSQQVSLFSSLDEFVARLVELVTLLRGSDACTALSHIMEVHREMKKCQRKQGNL